MIILIVLWIAIICHMEFMGHMRIGTHEVHGLLKLVVSTIVSTMVTLITGLIGIVVISII